MVVGFEIVGFEFVGFEVVGWGLWVRMVLIVVMFLSCLSIGLMILLLLCNC